MTHHYHCLSCHHIYIKIQCHIVIFNTGVQFQKVKCCRKTLKIMEMHFFTLNNDIFSGQQVWATFVEIGSPYPTADILKDK